MRWNCKTYKTQTLKPNYQVKSVWIKKCRNCSRFISHCDIAHQTVVVSGCLTWERRRSTVWCPLVGTSCESLWSISVVAACGLSSSCICLGARGASGRRNSGWPQALTTSSFSPVHSVSPSVALHGSRYNYKLKIKTSIKDGRWYVFCQGLIEL